MKSTPSLPNEKIEVLGPPPTSGTRDAFVELVMEDGCKKFDFIKAMENEDKKKYKAVCHTVREDGAYVEAGENDNLIVQKLETRSECAGHLRFQLPRSEYRQNPGFFRRWRRAPRLTTSPMANTRYPDRCSSTSKKAHVGIIPGMEEYLAEFTSDKAWGEEGYLAEKGLIPMPDAERKSLPRTLKP